MNPYSPIVGKAEDSLLKIIVIGRISTPEQDEESIDADQADAEKWLRQYYKGPMHIERLGEQASGWLVNRPTMERAQQLISTRKWDLVLASELPAIYRNPASHWGFVYHCVDHDTRFICIQDLIDTADPQWETMMHVASMRHGLSVPETRRRVKSKASFSFEHGGMVLKVKFGYHKLSKEEAASGEYGTPGLRIAKLSEWTPTIEEMAPGLSPQPGCGGGVASRRRNPHRTVRNGWSVDRSTGRRPLARPDTKRPTTLSLHEASSDLSDGNSSP